MLDVYLALGDERVSVATGKGIFAPCNVHGREYYPVAIVERDIPKLIDYLVTDFNLVSSDEIFVNVIPNEDEAFTNAVIDAARVSCSGCDAADLTEIMARALARLSERPELETGEFGVNYLGKSFVMRDGKVARGAFDPFALRLSGAELFSCLSENGKLPDSGTARSLDDLPFEIELDDETRAAIDREFTPYARRLARIAENMKDHPHTTIERSDEADEEARRAERVRSLLAHAKVFSDEETAAGLCEAVSSCLRYFESEESSEFWASLRKVVYGQVETELKRFASAADSLLELKEAAATNAIHHADYEDKMRSLTKQKRVAETIFKRLSEEIDRRSQVIQLAEHEDKIHWQSLLENQTERKLLDLEAIIKYTTRGESEYENNRYDFTISVDWDTGWRGFPKAEEFDKYGWRVEYFWHDQHIPLDKNILSALFKERDLYRFVAHSIIAFMNEIRCSLCKIAIGVADGPDSVAYSYIASMMSEVSTDIIMEMTESVLDPHNEGMWQEVGEMLCSYRRNSIFYLGCGCASWLPSRFDLLQRIKRVVNTRCRTIIVDYMLKDLHKQISAIKKLTLEQIDAMLADVPPAHAAPLPPVDDVVKDVADAIYGAEICRMIQNELR